MAYKEKKRVMFFGLPITFTSYEITEEKITINSGLFNTTENSVYLYKILDVKLERTFMERLFGLGTVICYTGDVTEKVLKLIHIKNSKKITDYIFTNAEEMRKRRRTLNTQSLTAGMEHLSHEDLDGDGIPDCMEDD